MIIKGITIENFKGFYGVRNITMPHIAAIIGKNGIGKTTIMDAIRFGLTGTEPEGDIINKKSEYCSVTISLVDETGKVTDFTREKWQSKPSKFRIGNYATTLKAMNSKIESIIKIPLDKVKILSSSDIVASLKPQEFASLILDYIPEKMTAEDIIKLVPDSTIGMVETMEAMLPKEGIDLQILDRFGEFCRETRKDLKNQLAVKKTMLESYPIEDPGYDKEALEARLKEISDAEGQKEIYKVKKAAYDKALEALEKYNGTIARIKEEAGKITATRPDPDAIKKVKEKLLSQEETKNNQMVSLKAAKAAQDQLEKTLEALEKPICPISPLITCHENKTMAKEEISESVESTKEGIKALEVEIGKIEESIKDTRAEEEKLREDAKSYEKKIELLKQLRELEASAPEKPILPEAPSLPEEDIEDEKFQIKQKLKLLEDYNEGLKIKALADTIEQQVQDFEKLVRATAEKGPIRTGVVKTYLSVFEDLCNERSKKIRPEINFIFNVEDGVVVYMNNGKGSYLPYHSLSGGEKAYMLFIIMDMLSQLCGTRLLIIDELSVVDGPCFSKLLDLISEYEDDYDHILISAVDHTDTVEAVEEHKIPPLIIDGTPETI